MNAHIREAAAQWLVEFRTDKPSLAARREFVVWLRTSPEHIAAYLSVLALWEEAGCYDQQHRLDIDALVALARTDRSDRTVTNLRKVDLPDAATDPLAPEIRDSRPIIARNTILRRLLRPRTAVAALLSLFINFGVTWIATDPRNVAYTTRIAEQRSIVLSDGSHVDLDALSNLRVKFSNGERTVELVSGQALFHVMKDSKRPFVVRVDGTRLRAVGTVFDVNRTTQGTVLTVLEGRVAALAAATPAKSLFATSSSSGQHDCTTSASHLSAPCHDVKVDAGEQATITHSSITAPQAADTAAVTAWTRSLLIFAAAPLSVVAEEFNRFNWRQIVIVDPELSSWPVTGTFRPLDPQTLSDFVLFLRRQPGIDVVERADQITVRAQSHL